MRPHVHGVHRPQRDRLHGMRPHRHGGLPLTLALALALTLTLTLALALALALALTLTRTLTSLHGQRLAERLVELLLLQPELADGRLELVDGVAREGEEEVLVQVRLG